MTNHLPMDLFRDDPGPTTDEALVIDELLSLDGARVLDIGCGTGEKTRWLARKAASVLGLETDRVQLADNQSISDPPNVRFEFGAAEQIPADDAAFDAVLMFKSLHHVPIDMLDTALREIRRVLKVGGFAYISEPIYAGAFNEILRLFHDERAVREAAFAAEQRAVNGGLLSLVTQRFFRAPTHFEDFRQFEERVLNVTHTEHRLDPQTLNEVRARFEQHMGADGATFHMPIRVDLFSTA